MSILSSAHTHTNYCDGKSTAREMVESAIEKGFVSLGFSGHAPQHFDPPCCMSEVNEKKYFADIRALKEEFAARIKIYLGVERDYFSHVDPKNYEYYLASVHYLPDGDEFVGVDTHPDRLAEYVKTACHGDGLLFARNYYTLLHDYVVEFKPPIIGHIDLLRKYNTTHHFFDENCKEYRDIVLAILPDMAKTNAILEMNTGAIARGTMKEPYPAPFILDEWKRLGGEVMVNSDCHNAKFLDCFYPECEEILRAHGYDHAVRLGKDTMWERFSL